MSDCKNAVNNMTIQRMMFERAIEDHKKSEKTEGITKNVLDSHGLLYLGSVVEAYMKCSDKPQSSPTVVRPNLRPNLLPN